MNELAILALRASLLRQQIEKTAGPADIWKGIMSFGRNLFRSPARAGREAMWSTARSLRAPFSKATGEMNALASLRGRPGVTQLPTGNVMHELDALTNLPNAAARQAIPVAKVMKDVPTASAAKRLPGGYLDQLKAEVGQAGQRASRSQLMKQLGIGLPLAGGVGGGIMGLFGGGGAPPPSQGGLAQDVIGRLGAAGEPLPPTAAQPQPQGAGDGRRIAVPTQADAERRGRVAIPTQAEIERRMAEVGKKLDVLQQPPPRPPRNSVEAIRRWLGERFGGGTQRVMENVYRMTGG